MAFIGFPLGSSPLTRGKHAALLEGHVAVRLIPAHAGKTPSSRSAVGVCRAHPRSRGENVIGKLLSAVGEGSSPLTRGKPDRTVVVRPPERLIPAHAGKTSPIRADSNDIWAHPRSRGENGHHVVRLWAARGSSPLTRGKLRRRLGRRGRQGLIPAHAGKTVRLRSARTRPWAHPRSRGENSILSPALERRAGSSPLTRGKPIMAPEPAKVTGLIPAHAGKTSTCSTSGGHEGAHPRSRGENLENLMVLGSLAGSSPLTRGKHLALICALPEQGLIPAHAGKTRASSIRRGQGWAHPRSRGENPSPPIP